MRRKESGAETWIPIYQALNLPFINEFARDLVWDRIDLYLDEAGLPQRSVPLIAEKALARAQTEEQARLQREAALRTELERLRRPQIAPEPRWGSKEAKRREIERLREQIATRKKP